MLSVIQWKPFSLGLKYFSSKCSAFQECHPVKQTHKALGSKLADRGYGAQCASVLSLPPHSLGDFPEVSILLSLENIFLIPLEWQKYSSFFQELESSCLHLVCWNSCLSGGRGWFGDRGMQSGIRCTKPRPATLSTVYVKQRFIWKGGQIAEALAVLFSFSVSILSGFCYFLLWELWWRLERCTGCMMACEKELGISGLRWYSNN